MISGIKTALLAVPPEYADCIEYWLEDSLDMPRKLWGWHARRKLVHAQHGSGMCDYEVCVGVRNII